MSDTTIPQVGGPVVTNVTQSGITYGDPNLAAADATANYRNAQADYFRAQTIGQEIDNRTAIALATSAEVALDREQVKLNWERASNGRNRVYHFTDVVDGNSVEAAVDVLNRWTRLDADNQEPYRFVICSGGGNVVFGMKLFSTLQSIATKRPVITVASGYCASMATVIHQSGTTRLIEPGTSYMLHDVSGDMAGKITDIQDTLRWMDKLNSSLHAILASKSNKDVAEIAAMCSRKDAWLMPEEVIEMGLAD